MPPHTARAAERAELARARAAVGALKQTLLGRLTPELEHGTVNAITVCSAEAPGIAAVSSRDGVAVGRATRRPRNPAHAGAHRRRRARGARRARPGDPATGYALGDPRGIAWAQVR